MHRALLQIKQLEFENMSGMDLFNMIGPNWIKSSSRTSSLMIHIASNHESNKEMWIKFPEEKLFVYDGEFKLFQNNWTKEDADKYIAMVPKAWPSDMSWPSHHGVVCLVYASDPPTFLMTDGTTLQGEHKKNELPNITHNLPKSSTEEEKWI